MNRQVIILNAPPNSGKDTIADAIQEVTGCDHLRFKDYLYHLTSKLFGVDEDWLIKVATDRETKEKAIFDDLWVPWVPYQSLAYKFGYPIPSFRKKINLSPRDSLIYTSEIVVKPKFGVRYFGRELAKRLVNPLSVVSDGGFDKELLAVIDEIGPENVFLVQWKRKGTSFKGDSRSYIKPPKKVNLLKTTNDGTIGDLVKEILTWREEINAKHKNK